MVIQKENASKIDRVIKELIEINKRVDVHDDDITEMIKVIQELDADRIQDGKTTEILKQKYDLLDERIENLSVAIVEVNSTLIRVSKIQVDNNDLNVIKEACLQDFTTLNDRINDISETVEVMGDHIERNEKEIESIKILKQPKMNMMRKDISSPLRSSMSQHLGSNLHKRRSDSQTEVNRLENIQRLTDQDTFGKYEQKKIRERDSVLSGSKITRYLGDSFDEGNDLNYKTNSNRIEPYKDGSKNRPSEPYEHSSVNKFQKLNRNMRSSPGEDVIVEDFDSGYEDNQVEKMHKESNQKPMSSKQSDYTFKADEIFNNDTEQDSHHKKTVKDSDKISSLQKKKSEELKRPSSVVDMANKKSQNIWNEKARDNELDKEVAEKRKSIREIKNQSMKLIENKPKEEPQHMQLGPIGGDTLDEESSEEGYESDSSIGDDEYFQGHITQKHDEIKKHEKQKELEDPDEQLDDWDHEDESEKPKDSNKMYQYYNPGKQSVSNSSKPKDIKSKAKGKMDDLNLDDLIDE